MGAVVTESDVIFSDCICACVQIDERSRRHVANSRESLAVVFRELSVGVINVAG